MSKIAKHRGLSGDLEIPVALPTDDPTKWRMREGKISFWNGAVVCLEVKGGFVPHFQGAEGLTVTYCIFNHIKQDHGRLISDVVMTTCLNGLPIDTNDIAFGVEVIPVPEVVAPTAGVNQTLKDLLPSHS
jgi:hypothetical protein